MQRVPPPVIKVVVRARVVSVVALIALFSAACGAAVPDPIQLRTAAPSPSASRARADSSPSATAASTPPATTSPTHAPATKPSPAPTPANQPWVGKFQGTTIKIPEGHGAPVSFTFDDGPSVKYTPQVLALLKENKVPAVFCLIGTQARANPRLVRQEVRAGHQLCDHSRDHDLQMKGRSQAYVNAEVNDGLADIRAAAPGVPVSFYRQPGGTWSPAVVRAMDQAKLYPLRWSDDPRDWSRPGSTVIVQRVIKNLHPGAVILMHDGGGDRSQTVAALAWLLKSLRAAGWHPVLAPKVKISPKAAAKPQ